MRKKKRKRVDIRLWKSDNERDSDVPMGNKKGQQTKAASSDHMENFREKQRSAAAGKATRALSWYATKKKSKSDRRK